MDAIAISMPYIISQPTEKIKSFRCRIDEKGFNILDLEGEYFSLNNDLEIKPSSRMRKTMENIINMSGVCFSDEERSETIKDMTNKLFTSSKPKVVEDYNLINNMKKIISSSQFKYNELLKDYPFEGVRENIYDFVFLSLKRDVFDFLELDYDREFYNKVIGDLKIKILKSNKASKLRSLEVCLRDSINEEVREKTNEVLKEMAKLEEVSSNDNKKTNDFLAYNLGLIVELLKKDIYLVSKYPNSDSKEVRDLIKSGLDKILEKVKMEQQIIVEEEFNNIKKSFDLFKIEEDEGLSFDNL